MKEHKWFLEEVDGGSLGVQDFWKCSECGANGGFPIGNQTVRKPSKWIFYADGSGLNLPEDCDEAKIQIDTHLFKKSIKGMK